ncbi:MAG: hypothetical protein IKP66_10100 [Lachnospiraceae bacterium]|nr:hypothetical protein [Lachnospiraceae bacterium]
MIVGRTKSADGGFRRIPVRHTHIVDEKTRLELVEYLKGVIYEKCKEVDDWVGYRDLFPNIPEDLVNTPLNILWNICCEKFKDDPDSIIINISKYLGMLVREAVYYSEQCYLEQMRLSIRTYRLGTKEYEEQYIRNNRYNLINGNKE